MDPKIFILMGFLAVSFALLGIAIGVPPAVLPPPVKLVVLFFALFFDVLAFASRRYSYVMLPMLKQRSRNIVLSAEEPYRLASSEDSIIRREGGEFTATVYISIPFYRSATEMSDAEKLEYSRQMSRLIGISSDPIRFTTELYLMNKDAYIQELKDEINAQENEEAALVQSKADPDKLEIVRGKLAMWRNVTQSSNSSSSMELVSYAAISASGSKEYEAVSLAQQKAREVISGIGSTLGVTPIVVTGKEILKFVESEYLIPFSTVSEQMEKKVEEQVV